MTTRAKIKYAIATIVLFALFIITTAFKASKDVLTSDGVKLTTVAIDFTYGLLFLAAFLFGGIVTGISSIFGVGLYILLNNKSPWLALIALVVGLTAGITVKLTSILFEKKKIDKRAILISAGIFFIAFGVVFTAARAMLGSYYALPIIGDKTRIYFLWPLYVLPYIVGAIFLVLAIFINKLQENVQQASVKAAFVSSSVFVMYTIIAFLCSLSRKLSMTKILANTYTNYLLNFYISGLIGILAAIVIYVIGYAVIEIRIRIKNALKDVE